MQLVELGKEAASYLRESLEGGPLLSKSLSDLPLETGAFFALLPEGVASSRAHAFNEGGVITNPTEGVKRDEFLSSLIQSHLKASTDRYAIFQDVNHRRDSQLLSDVSFFICGSDLYLFLDPSMSEFRAVDTVLRKASRYPFVGILTPAGEISPIQPRGEVTPDVVVGLARNTVHIIVGAYDEESYLLWRRGGLAQTF